MRNQDLSRYTDLPRLCGGHWSHIEVANKVRMLMRSDLDHEAVCTTARDRIMHLAGREAALEAEVKEYEEGYSEIACALGDENGGNHDSIMGDIAATVARVRALEALAVELGILLTELVDIEGPQPGTSDWAVKVKAALASPLLAGLMGKEAGR